jgi:3-hydroxyisobutyrate dehydrogenase-like beta-hydroxyacid dehydrogenase
MQYSVSVIGLGKMGRPIARTLIAAGWRAQGFNRSSLSKDLTHGIPLCQQIEDAAQVEVCLLMLADSIAVDEVLGSLEPHLASGQIVLDMGSSHPERSKVHARRLEMKGIGWVDAPVSGGPGGAASGTLAVMAGGNADVFNRVEPILNVLGGNVVHVGGPGAGHTAKIINQVIVGLTIEAVAEGLTLAERTGINLHLVQKALTGGWADSEILQNHGTRMINRNYEPGAYVRTQLKDLRMAQAIARAKNVTLPHLDSTIKMCESLVAEGDEKLDHAAIHKLFLKPGETK